MKYLIALDVPDGIEICTILNSLRYLGSIVTHVSDNSTIDQLDVIVCKDTLSLNDRDLLSTAIGGGAHFNTN